jgi:outer membrane receptor for ferrienterochelin and colicins
MTGEARSTSTGTASPRWRAARVFDAGAAAAPLRARGRAKLTVDATRFAEDRRGGNLLRLPPDEATSPSGSTRAAPRGAPPGSTREPAFDYRVTISAGADTTRDSYYGTPGSERLRRHAVPAVARRHAGQPVRRTPHGLVGRAGSWEALGPAAGLRTADARRRLPNAGLFVQDDWAFGRGWQVLTGLAPIGTRPSTASSRRRARADVLAARGARHPRVGRRGFRAPQVFDEDLHLTRSAARSAHPARSRACGRDVDQLRWPASSGSPPSARPGAARGERLLDHARRSLPRHREHRRPGDASRGVPQGQRGAARVYGVELNAGWGIGDDLRLQGGVVVQRARFAEPEPDFGSRDFFRTPPALRQPHVTWRHPRYGDWFAGPALHRLDEGAALRGLHRRGPPRDDTGVRHARCEPPRGRPKLALTVGGRNLTNAYQEDLDRGPLRDASYVYGPRFPRSLVIGLRVEY